MKQTVLTTETALAKSNLLINGYNSFGVLSNTEKTHTIGGLSFTDGGTLDATEIPVRLGTHGTTNAQFLTLTNQGLDATGNGVIQLKIADSVPSLEKINTEGLYELSLLDQDDGTIQIKNENGESTYWNGVKLIGVTDGAEVIGTGANISYTVDHNTYNGESKISRSISQDNVKAEGYYDYGLSAINGKGNNAGLYLTYKLTKVDIQEGSLVLTEGTVNKNSSTTNYRDFSAQIVGSGNLVIISKDGRISLSNSNNEYTGTTSVTSGTVLETTSDTVLGQNDPSKQTSEVILHSNSGLEIGKTNQYIGTLTVNNNAYVDIGTGLLSVNKGGTTSSSNALKGTGTINLVGDTFYIKGANSELRGSVKVIARGQVNINHEEAIGSSDIYLEEGTTLNLNRDGAEGSLNNLAEVKHNLKGSGTVTFEKASVTSKGDNSEFSGKREIKNGSELAFVGLTNNNRTSQIGKTDSSIFNSGLLFLNLSDNTTSVNDISGTGAVYISGGKELTVNQDSYRLSGLTHVVESGTGLTFGSYDNPQNLATQVLLDVGTHMAGFGSVTGLINAGTLFLNDRSLVEAKPVTFTVTSVNGSSFNSTGNYIGKGGLIVFNASLSGDNDSLQDRLHIEGNAEGTSYVLVNNLGGQGARTEKGIVLVTIDGKSSLSLSLASPLVAGAYEYSLASRNNDKEWYLFSSARTDSSSYVANSASYGYVNMRLHDRLGQTAFQDPITHEVKDSAVWVRIVGIHNHSRMESGSNAKTHSKIAVGQIGSDLVRGSINDDWKYNLGIFAGGLYSRSDSKALSRVKGRVDGYTLGIYGTLYSGNSPDDGFYVDTWLTYGRYDNQIFGNTPKIKYDAYGWTGSLELGYTVPLGETGESGYNKLYWSVQPQAQVIISGVSAEKTQDVYGNSFESAHGHQMTTRLGFRIHANKENNGFGLV